jgi:transcriptional regulator with XRE-family HTH domain
MNEQGGDAVLDIGRTIKNLRTKNHITLRELAQRSDLSIGFLSQLERGMTNLAVDSLQNISAALGVEPNYFFNDRKKSGETLDTIVRSGGRAVYKIEDGVRLHYGMSENLDRHLLFPEIVSLLPEPDSDKIHKKAYSQGTEEFIYVLSGVLTVSFGGRTHRMFRGDSVAFRPATPRNWYNDTNQITEILLARCPNPLYRKNDESEAPEI